MGKLFTPCRFIIVFLVFVWICCCSFMKQSSASILNCSSIERNALIDFKQKLLDPSARLSSWVGHNCCEWHGITCDFISGMVTKIDLHNSKGAAIFNDFLQFKKSSLGGDISSSLLHLHDLRYLDLSFNYFGHASIPYFFGMFTNLRYLNLSFAYFGGEIPPHLGNLSHLNYLDLSTDYYDYSENLLHVENLNWLSSLSSLEYLDLGMVNLNKAQENWMKAVNKLSSLTELHLRSCDISTFDSSTGLQNLTSLRVLDLSNNYVNSSSLPLWLSNLTSLTKLDLSSSSFSGTISLDFVKLKKLQYLDLKCNDLEGEIPNSLGLLDKLQELDLSYNKLWGSLPNSIGNLSSLQDLILSNNDFNGIIPPSFGQLSKLISFESYDNSWEGVITEVHLANLTKLEILVIKRDIYHEALVFIVSYNWIPPFRLKTLYLKNCFIGPRFPIWIQVQTKLIDDVVISHAGIYGFMPNDWISHLSSHITALDLSNNLLQGKLSLLFASHKHLVNRSHHNLLGDHLIPLMYPRLQFLFLQNNLLSGPIPHNLGNSMPNMVELILSNNHLNGKINPLSFEKMTRLLILSLSYNQFSGEISDDWGKLKSLGIIDLANNSVYGKIPSSIGLLKFLSKLILSNNKFFGEISESLQNCSQIVSIDLSGNRLHGSLPEWMGVNNSELELINLRSNLFNGTIPTQWCNLRSLRVLDLSNNNLLGQIPSCLSNWETFIYGNDSIQFGRRISISDNNFEEKVTLVMKGRELEYDTTLKYVLTIDLSRNKLSGKIPNEITKFMYLGTLNLSNNMLVGAIPEDIGAMQKLDTLDLSCNHLSGKIPTSLGSLNFLSHLNLSHNNLTGTIPISNHLQTLEDPSIYEGNPFLHKSPQTKTPSDENTNNIHVPTSEANNEEQDSEMFSFFISMAIGFPVGLNILFFAIFTSESRRISYFCFVDRVSRTILEKVGILENCFKIKRSRKKDSR